MQKVQCSHSSMNDGLNERRLYRSIAYIQSTAAPLQNVKHVSLHVLEHQVHSTLSAEGLLQLHDERAA